MLGCRIGIAELMLGQLTISMPIPKKSTALISVDMQQMASGKSDEDKAGMLKSLLHVEDASKCGIDISEKIFLFESADGNLGLCAKVSDEGDVEDWLASLAKQTYRYRGEGAQRLSFLCIEKFVDWSAFLIRHSSLWDRL